MMGISRLAQADVPQAAELVAALPLYREYGYQAPSVARDLTAALADGHSDVRAAVVDGELSGVAWVLTHGAFGRSPYLRLLAVADGRQARGVGRALMAALEADWAPAKHLFLLVSEPNAGARLFYERLGYRQIGAMPGYVRTDVDECLYHKRLTAGPP